MESKHATTVDFERALADPAGVFARPLDVVLNDALAHEQKRRILERWRLDAQALAGAKDARGAGGPEPVVLDEVLEAEGALEEDAGGPGTDTVTTEQAREHLWREGGHKVAGLYDSYATAHAARQHLLASGVPETEIDVLSPSEATLLRVDRGEARAGVMKDAAVGAGVGAGIGAAGAAALVVANVALVVTAPVAAVLVGLGVGGLGGLTVGSVSSLSLRERTFLGIVREALAHDCWVVVVHAQSEQEALNLQDALVRTEAKQTVDHGGGTAG